MIEQWRVLEEFPDYEISNTGRIRRLTESKSPKTYIGKEKRFYKNNAGYYTTVFLKDNKVYCRTIHTLVAKTFIPNPNNLSDVDHIDDNKENNNVDNLQWLSHKENMSKFFGTEKHKLSIEKAKENRKKTMELKKSNKPKKVYKIKGYYYKDKYFRTLEQLKEYLQLDTFTYNQIKYYCRKNNITKKYYPRDYYEDKV